MSSSLTMFLKILEKNVITLTIFCLKKTYSSGFMSCKKIRYLIKKGHEKNEEVNEISSCVEQIINGFDIICYKLDKKQKQNFEPIVYKPVKNVKEIIECFFTNKIRLAYCAYYQCGKKVTFNRERQNNAICTMCTTAEQCFCVQNAF